MKKEIPILFSTPMVLAIIEGRKTMTRRVVKPAIGWGTGWSVTPIKEEHMDGIQRYEMRKGSKYSLTWFKCPFGKIGDVLWVRETLYQEGELGLYYLADKERIDEETIPEDYAVYRDYACCKVPAIHMQKSVARIWLEVTDIKVEKAQEITEQDAIAEGVESWTEERLKSKPTHYKVYRPCSDPEALYSSKAYDSFQTLWESINGIESWNQNPWVWVVSFKVLSTSGKPKDL
jgi:hypothetical protein